MAIDIRLYFDCTNKKTFVKDLTDYSTEIPSGVAVAGYGTLLSPSSTLIINDNSVLDPIIGFLTNPRVSVLYNLSSPIQAGQYTFNYTNYYEYITLPENNQYITILTNNSVLVPGELASLFTVGDTINISNSDNAANDGTYTITASENQFGNTVFTINASNLVPLNPVSNDTLGEATITKTSVIYTNKVYTYSACSSTPTACVEFSYDCFTGAYGSGQITDTTDYTGYTIESRTLTAYYPNALDPAPAENPVSTSNAIININELATGTWSAKVSSIVSKVQEDGLVLQSTVSTLKEFNVSCSSNMCGLSDCLTKLKDKHISYLKSSNISPLQQYVDNVQLLYTMAKEAQACGDKNAYSDYVSQIYEVLKKTESDCGCSTSSSCSCGCESDGSCGCGDQTPQWVNNIGIDIDSLLAEFETFMTETLPTILSDIESLQNDMTQVQGDIVNLQNQIDNIDSGLSVVTVQTGNNTTSIDELDAQINTPVTGLAAQVELLQEEIATLGSSNSEVSLNELFNELPTTQQGVWKCVEGYVTESPSIYQVVINGDQTIYLEQDDEVSFYNPTTQSWFTGTIQSAQFLSGQTIIEINCGIIPCEFLDSLDSNNDPIPFPLFIKSTTSNISGYNFRKQFVLQNDAYWQFEDLDNKYWSKLNVVFASNHDVNVSIQNITTSQSSPYIRVKPGMFVELEFIFEKQWTGTAYNTSFVGDIKFSGGLSSNGVQGSTLSNGGYYGYNPSWDNGLNLNNSLFISQFGVGGETFQPGCVLTQDVYQGFGDNGNNQNTTAQREIVRYNFGPSYPNNTSPLFFNGDVPESLVFNFLNNNITIFKFEQSFGRFPNNLL